MIGVLRGHQYDTSKHASHQQNNINCILMCSGVCKHINSRTQWEACLIVAESAGYRT